MNIQLQKFDTFLKVLIWYSVVLYLFELCCVTENSRVGHPFFLWSERVVASILTIEFLIRLKRYKWSYFKSPLGIIDLISILPFWIGFFVPTSWLGVIRDMRVLRLLKYFRYSRGMQLIALGFYRAIPPLKSFGLALLIVMIVSTVAMYRLEHKSQPEKFDNLFSAAWFTFVTSATIGYGDIAPVTKMGRFAAVVTFLPTLAIFAGVIGVLAQSFSKVVDEEIDPNVDPIEEFYKERARQKQINKINLEYRK